MVNEIIFNELIKRGYSLVGTKRVWDISDSRLWFITPELVQGFRGIENYEPYRKNIIEKETFLIKNYLKNIIKDKGLTKFNLIDIACSRGMRGTEIVKNLPDGVKVRYVPVDISEEFILDASNKIKALNSKNICEIKGFVTNFKDFYDILGSVRNPEYNRNLVFFLGSFLATYEINDFLYSLSESLINGDIAVFGIGLRKKVRLTELEKYKHDLFNQWFIQIMKELEFMEDEVKYDARFNSMRVEGFYRILKDKIVSANAKKISFRKDDEIIVAVHYKFFEDELKKFCGMYFSDVKLITDDGDYCLIVCTK